MKSQQYIASESQTEKKHNNGLIVSPSITEKHWSSPNFKPEERIVIEGVLGISPDTQRYEDIPAFTTRYEHLHTLTEHFVLNRQATEVEKRRAWHTQLKTCKACGGVSALWIDRSLLTVGSYCERCQKDTPLGSYLEIELARPLPNAIQSSYQGYLGDNPDFRNFDMWHPGRISHLGAAMSTGKTTEIKKAIRELALQGGRGIIAVPRVSLARFLAYQLRRADGGRAWGLWHEGGERSDRFVGTLGAICCLPSLSRVVEKAIKQGLNMDSLYIAVDELDFSYELLALTVEQASLVKDTLRRAIRTNGLVTAGQTVYTAVLEAFSDEMQCEDVRGFYNTAPAAKGTVELRKYPDSNDKSLHMLAGVVASIENHFRNGRNVNGRNVYVFCDIRRDAEVLADIFGKYKPVLYTGKSKGDPRADAVLRNKKVTDTPLFIGTSAVGIGLSIRDEQGVTEILTSLRKGRRDVSMTVQEAMRNRCRNDITIHYTDYKLKLPISPSKSEIVSLYHEEIKQRTADGAHLPEASVQSLARGHALSTLADWQFETYVRHHLGNIANMSIVSTCPVPLSPDRIECMRKAKNESIRRERKIKCRRAVELLREMEVLTESEIRKQSAKGLLTPMPTEQLAHEFASGLLQAVGWNGEIDPTTKTLLKDFLGVEQEIAISMAKENVNPERLAKQRSGWLAVHYPQVVSDILTRDVRKDDKTTAVRDDRFRGQLLRSLLSEIACKHFTEADLAAAVRTVLNRSDGFPTFLEELQRGALGADTYSQIRFFYSWDDESVIKWVRNFISESYPARIEKKGSLYALVLAKDAELKLESFRCWMQHQNLETAEPPPIFYNKNPLPKPPDPLSAQKEKAREMKRKGYTRDVIAQETGLSLGAVSNATTDIKVDKKKARKLEAYRLSKEEKLNHLKIADRLGVKSHTTVGRWIRQINEQRPGIE